MTLRLMPLAPEDVLEACCVTVVGAGAGRAGDGDDRVLDRHVTFLEECSRKAQDPCYNRAWRNNERSLNSGE